MERWERYVTSLRDGRDLTPDEEMGEIRHLTKRWEKSDTTERWEISDTSLRDRRYLTPCSRRDGKDLTPHGERGEI
jgi:hypothetical protein